MKYYRNLRVVKYFCCSYTCLFNWFLVCIFFSSHVSVNLVSGSFNNFDAHKKICKSRKTCDSCVPVNENDNYCVWSMLLSACVSSTSVYKPQNLTDSRKYAGIVSTFARCSIETADFYFLFHTRTQPQLHPSLQHIIEANGYSHQYLLGHPEFIHNNGGVRLNLQWPVNGARASRAEMPISIGVEVSTALGAEPTLKTCFEMKIVL